MRTIVKGKHVEVPDRVRDYAERKLRRLERLTDDQTDAVVECWVEQHRSADDSHIVDLSLVIGGRPLHGRAAGVNWQAAIDEVVDKLERQAVELKEKPRVRARPEQEKQILRQLADGTATDGADVRIVKMKRFAIEPMFEEDAVTRMEELGHTLLRVRQRRDRARRHPVPPQRRRLRDHRTDRRRRLHDPAGADRPAASRRGFCLRRRPRRRGPCPPSPTRGRACGRRSVG